MVLICFLLFIQSGTPAQGTAPELRVDLPSQVTNIESPSQVWPPRFVSLMSSGSDI